MFCVSCYDVLLSVCLCFGVILFCLFFQKMCTNGSRWCLSIFTEWWRSRCKYWRKWNLAGLTCTFCHMQIKPVLFMGRFFLPFWFIVRYIHVDQMLSLVAVKVIKKLKLTCIFLGLSIFYIGKGTLMPSDPLLFFFDTLGGWQVWKGIKMIKRW